MENCERMLNHEENPPLTRPGKDGRVLRLRHIEPDGEAVYGPEQSRAEQRKALHKAFAPDRRAKRRARVGTLSCSSRTPRHARNRAPRAAIVRSAATTSAGTSTDSGGDDGPPGPCRPEGDSSRIGSAGASQVGVCPVLAARGGSVLALASLLARGVAS